MGKVENYDEFLPKTEKCLVGNKELVVSELNIGQRDAIVGKLLGSHDVAGALSEIRRAVEKKEGDAAAGAGTVFELVSKLFSGDLTHVACVVLDTPANMKAVFGDKQEMEGSMKGWIRASLTARQEVELLRKVFEVNDFVELGKNYMSLVGNLMGSDEGEKTEEATGQTST